MASTDELDIDRSWRWRWPVTGVTAALVVSVSATAAFFAGSDGHAGAGPVADVPSPAMIASATPRWAVTPAPLGLGNGSDFVAEPAEASVPPAEAKKPIPQPAAQPVTADPVRVHTGDGDCLNVRPQPGTTFATDPYSCLPEGTLLWLRGPEKLVDGELWRYALGSGWVAVRYTKATEAPPLRLPAQAKSVTVIQQGPDGRVTAVSIDPRTGAVVARPDLGDAMSALPSPSGRFVATFDGSTGAVVPVAGGASAELGPQAFAVMWHASDKLLVRQLGRAYWFDTETGVMTPLSDISEEENGMFWAADGASAYLVLDNKLVRVWLDGSRDEIGNFPEGISLWNAAPSPDGRSLATGGGLIPIQIVDLTTGAVTTFAQAPQRTDVGGGCGGGWSMVIGWFDSDTLFYHERTSRNKQDGITLGHLGSGQRTVMPFFDVQSLTSAGDGLLSFSTWIWDEDGPGEPILFLVDPVTGDTWPLFTGNAAAWPGSGQVVSATGFYGI